MADDRGVIDVDDPRTWPPHVHTFIEPFVERLAGTTEHTSDLAIRPEEDDAFQATLTDVLLKVYHGTRLLDHEVASIRQDGLQLTGEDLVSGRIEAAWSAGAISGDQRDQLLGGTSLAVGSM